MNKTDRIAVCSRSFSANTILRSELQSRYAHITFNDSGTSLHGDRLVEFLQGHTKAIVGLEQLDEATLARIPELRVVSKVGVGTDMLDLDAMRRRGIRLGWTGGVNRRSVAELALAFIISLLRHIRAVNLDVTNGIWKQRIGSELTGKTVGIVGLGNVGRELVLLLAPFRCRILAFDIAVPSDFCSSHGVIPMPLETLLAEADVVSLHTVLTSETTGLISKERLALMKPTAVLVNTARGGLVNEPAVKEALSTGKLLGAAFDVFADEPPRDDALQHLPNFIGTAHISGSTEEAVLAMGRAAIAGLDEHVIPGGG